MADNLSLGSGEELYHPVFPAHWQRRPLYSMASWANGLAFRDIQFSESGMPVIKIAEIKDGISGQTRFTEETFDDSVRVRPGDLLFAWSGQPETSINAFSWQGPVGWLNQHIFRVTPAEGIDRTFFFYLLRYMRPHFVAIARNKQTTGLGHVTRRDLERIEAAFPGMPEQRAIAQILGTLDDKIELNRRMNETLEAIARAIFQAWFVDFEPVWAKKEGRQPAGMDAETAALFPDDFEESELGLIPKGWTVGSLELAADNVRSSVRPEDCREVPYVGLEHIPRQSISLASWGQADEVESLKMPFTSGDILFGKLRPYFHKVVIAPIDGVCSSEVLVVRATRPASREFVLLHLSSIDLINFATALSTGTRMPRTSWSDIITYRVAFPPENLLHRFSDIARPLIDRTVANVEESRTIAALRDVLLPKLVSGELRVKDA